MRHQRPPADIESALDELGIEWKASGSHEAAAFCPHPDHDNTKTEAWSINLETGLHSCFSCGYKGNWQQLVRDVLGLSAGEATAWTQQRQSIGTRQRSVVEGSATIGFHRRERETPEVEESELWPFVPPPDWAMRERRLNQAACEEYEVLWDADREVWITPIRDPYTSVLMGWQEKAEDGRYFRNYPRSVAKSRALFGLSVTSAVHQTILVESPLDAVRIRAAGIRGAVSSFGVRVSEAQRALLRMRAQAGASLVCALDNDDAGLEATAQLLGELPGARVLAYDHVPSLKDPGEMTDAQLSAALDQASGAISFLRKHRAGAR